MSPDVNQTTRSEPPLQFDAVIPADATTPLGLPTCTLCKQQVADRYFEANGKVVCAACRTRVEAELASGAPKGSFPRALVYGVAAGALGAAVYYAILKLTDINFGLISVLVGYMIGKAVRKATAARGRRGYQVLALMLAWFAIAGTYIPFFFAKEPPSVLAIIIAFFIAPVAVAVASPFSGFISAFALYEAWKLSARMTITFTGPYKVGGPTMSAATA